MVEPRRRLVRPNGMRHLLAPTGTAVALALLVGCGSTTADGPSSASSTSTTASGSPSASPTAATASPRVGDCAADDPAVTGARGLSVVPPLGTDREGTARATRVDLDGDRREDPVKTTAADAAACPATLFAEVADGFLVAPVVDGDPGTLAAFAARLPGEDADLLVTQQQHPRGGTQTRVYAAADGALAELQDADGNPVVPFVATDTPPAPVSVTCGPGELVVTEAVAHEPAGVMFTWDVRQTTYAVTGGRAERTDRVEVADNVLPGQLRERFPELARAEVLADCRS